MQEFLYVTRSPIDFEYNEPLLRHTDCMVYEMLSSKRAPHTELFEFFQSRPAVKMLYRIISAISKFSRIFPQARPAIPIIESVLGNRLGADLLDLCNDRGIDTVIFDHISTKPIETACRLLKAKGFRIFSVPHAEYVFSNQLIDNHDIGTVAEFNGEFYDKIIGTSEPQMVRFNGRTIILPSLRHSHYWVNAKYADLEKRTAEQKTNVLVLHTKFIGGVSKEQVLRTINYLNDSCFSVRLRPHPRNGLKEIKKAALSNITLSQGDLAQDIAWADIVVHFQSSSFLDALVLGKTTIFAQFASSNTLQKCFTEGSCVCRSFDDFQSALLDATKFCSRSRESISESDRLVDFNSRLELWRRELGLK